MFLETLYRIYSTAGYNIAHIDVTAQLCEEHDIRYEDVDRVEAVVNWLETQYPEPGLPEPARGPASREAGQHARTTRAYGVVKRGFPVLRGSGRPGGADDPPEVLELMKRVTIIPSHRDDALRPAHHDLHEGRQELHEAGAPGASSSGTSTRRRAASAASSPACRSRRRSSRRSSRPAAISIDEIEPPTSSS